MDKVNNRMQNRPTNWSYADGRKFGWGLVPKNRQCRMFGYSMGKEYRKRVRQLTKRVRHSLLFHIPISKKDIEEVRFYDFLLYLRALSYNTEDTIHNP